MFSEKAFKIFEESIAQYHIADDVYQSFTNPYPSTDLLNHLLYRKNWILSKADKLSKNEQIKTLGSVKKSLKPYMTRQRISVQLFSSLKKQGIEEVNQVVGAWFATHQEEMDNLNIGNSENSESL